MLSLLRFLVFTFTAIAITGFVISLVFSNRHYISFSLFPLPWAVEMPLYILCAASLSFGIMIGVFTSFVNGFYLRARSSSAMKAYKKQIALMEIELRALRAKRVDWELSGDNVLPDAN